MDEWSIILLKVSRKVQQPHNRMMDPSLFILMGCRKTIPAEEIPTTDVKLRGGRACRSRQSHQTWCSSSKRSGTQCSPRMSTAWWSHPVHLAILDRYRITGRICSVIQPWSARWSAVRACWCQCDLHILIYMQHAYSQRERFHM